MPHGDEDVMVEQVSGGGITRRETLKRMGVAGALAWSAPVLSTLNSPAFAQAGTPSCAGAPEIDCTDPDSITQCGDSGPFGLCFCNEGVCIEDQFCDDLEPCTSDADCQAGEVCQTSCCNEPRCIPLCGSAAGAAIDPTRGVQLLRVSGILDTLPPLPTP